jgi:3-phenylpropionate/trans-cinnamate dioxygenase ferredoxin component
VPLLKLARVDEVPPGQSKYFPLEHGPIVLANYEGTIHAISGLCLHKLNPLDGATMWGPYIDCPYHHFQYDVRNGANHFPQNVYPKDMPTLGAQLKPLKTYAVEVREGEVWVNIDE